MIPSKQMVSSLAAGALFASIGHAACVARSSIATTATSSAAATSTSIAASATSVSTMSNATSVSSTSSTASVSTQKSTSSTGTKYLMVFGDSYSSIGYYGGAASPSSSNPIGLALPGTTTDGGLNWVGYSATTLNTSLTLVYDYAVYGATLDSTLVRGSTDVLTQVGWFQSYAEKDAGWTADNTMAIFWIGINDVGNSYWDGVDTPISKIHDEYFEQLQTLYDAGIRYFTLFTIPPAFVQAPVMASETTQNMGYLSANITAYNDDLATRLATFKAANSGVVAQMFDTADSFSVPLADPTSYGATDATCMNSDGTSCLWYDNYHPGQAIQKLVATNFMAALTGVFF